MGLPGEWKEHESFKERDMNVVERKKERKKEGYERMRILDNC